MTEKEKECTVWEKYQRANLRAAACLVFFIFSFCCNLCCMDSYPVVSAAAGVAAALSIFSGLWHAVKGLVIRIRYGSAACLCAPVSASAEPKPAKKPRSILVPVALAGFVGFLIGRNEK